jgi:two-component system LytT family response regulator
MTRLRVLVVDDEPLAREGLAAILRAERDVAVIGESATGAEALAAIASLHPDVVFLDIGLPDMDGFTVLERLGRDHRPVVVFVTAHADGALRAFEVRALDYVVKPLRRDRVREALARARERVRLERLEASPAPAARAAADAPSSGSAPLAIKTDGRVHLIDQQTIEWIAADDDHVVVHGAGTSWRARERLRDVERRLDPAAFVRIHRSTIVRLSRIRELQPWFHGDWIVILHGGAKLRLSRSHREAVGRRLGREL